MIWLKLYIVLVVPTFILYSIVYMVCGDPILYLLDIVRIMLAYTISISSLAWKSCNDIFSFIDVENLQIVVTNSTVAYLFHKTFTYLIILSQKLSKYLKQHTTMIAQLIYDIEFIFGL